MNIKEIKNSNTKYLGKNILYFDELESTQDLAKQLVKENVKNGTVILTDYQTKGKGTNDRKWYSSKGKNIMMTIIIYPHFSVKQLDGLTVEIAKQIQIAIQELYEIPLTIKEPNDLLLNNQKIAGILTQSATYENSVTHILIGIGFNVNEEFFSEEVKDIATSLKKEYHQEFSREEIISKILEKLEKILNVLSYTKYRSNLLL